MCTWRCIYIIRNIGGDTIAIGSSHTIETILEFGTYLIEWTVSDGCGNFDFEIQEIEIRSTKAPSPICINGFAVNLTPVDLNNDGVLDDEQATLWANDLDGGSYHSCSNPIILSLEKDTSIRSRLFTCADIGIVSINLWVTDVITGAQDYCSTFVIVQDNNNQDICEPADDLVTIKGNIYTDIGEKVEDVKVDLGIPIIEDTTDISGEYSFENMPMGGTYLITPKKNNDFLNGVTTLDLVLIQRHIFALERLNSPYKLIAADINRSDHITARDLIELRKLILGINEGLPDNTSWRFVDSQYDFPELSDPWFEEFPEDYSIDSLNADMLIDFVGVKIGDVNNDVIANSNLSEDETSLARKLTLKIEEQIMKSGELGTIKVFGSGYSDISGMQGTLEFNPEVIEIVNIEAKSIDLDASKHFNLSNQDQGWMSFSYNDFEVQSRDEDELLFEIKLRTKKEISSQDIFTLSSKITPLQAYRGFDQLIDVKLDYSLVDKTRIISVNPNPWVERSEILFELENEGKVEWEFYDLNGNLISKKSEYYESGINSLEIERSRFNIRGVVYIKMKTQKSIYEHKMIIID